MARPTECTPELTQRIVLLIMQGNYPAIAAVACGIGRRTYFEWMDKGERGLEPYAEFFASVKEAHAISEADLLNTVQKAAKNGEWQAAAWILERTRGTRYVRRMAPEDKKAQEDWGMKLAAAMQADKRKQSA